MDSVDTIIVGAGVVGLAIAERLSRKDANIVVVETHDGFGRETSSRNSEVIHAGIYYPETSLKAQLCVEGNRLLSDLCRRVGIPYRKTGKIVVSNHEQETKAVHDLFRQGNLNGVSGLEILSKQQVAELEPQVKCELGLYSPETAIFDTHQLMKYLETEAEGRGVILAYSCTVVAVHKVGSGFEVEIVDSDGERIEMRSTCLINSAGLQSDKIAEMAGIDVDREGCRLYPCKGEYFSVSDRHKGKLSHLVYPPPNSIGLGVHIVLSLDDRLKLGPSAFYVDKIDYDVDPGHLEEFAYDAKRYLPFVEESDLAPDMSGVRPKLQKDGEGFRDFIIREESARGLSGLINLLGIESPGLTSSLAIARMVESFS